MKTPGRPTECAKPALPRPSGRTGVLRPAAITLLGSFIALAAESVHQWAEVWRLPAGASLPWWIVAVYWPALFVAASVFSQIEKKTGHRLQVSRASLAVETVILVALFLAPPLLHEHEGFLAVLATAYLLLRLGMFRARGDLTAAMFAMGADLLIEGTLVATAFYTYTETGWAPLPLWLPPLWGGMGLGLRRLALSMVTPRTPSP